MSSLEPDYSLAKEPLSLQEVLALVEQGHYQHEYQQLVNRCYHFFEQARAKCYLKKLNYKRIQKYLNDSGTQILPHKAIQLSQWVRKLRPSVICEFGGGGSTILFAELLEKYGIDGRVITLEQSTDYYERITSAIPDVHKDRIEVHKCSVRYHRIEGYRCLFYDLPDLPGSIDFLYIDGPSPQKGDPVTEQDIFFDGDIYHLAQKNIFCKFVVNDCRWFNFKFYKSTLGQFYRFRPTVKYRSFLMEYRTDKPSAWSKLKLFGR